MKVETQQREDSGKKPLPKGWRRAKLGGVAKYINGMAFKPEDWGNSGLPIIRIQNLTSESAAFNCYDGEIDERYLVHNGDLLISWSASLDAYIWNRGDAVLNQHIFKIEEDPSLIHRDFMFFAVREVMDEIRGQVHGATMRHITKPEFEAIEIPLPPLAEQKRIAEILNQQMATVEKARVAAESELEAAKALPAAYLRQVFPKPGQSLPKGWRWAKLADNADLLPSKSIASDGDCEVQTITTASLTELGFNPAGVKQARMWSSDVPVCTVAVNEVLIARSNTPELVGRVARFEGVPLGAVASDLTIRIRAKNDLAPGYLTGYLSSLFIRGYWKDNAGGASGTMKKITRTQVDALSLPLAPFVEQQRITAFLKEWMAAVDKARLAAETQLKDIDALPAMLLRRAFNGEL